MCLIRLNQSVAITLFQATLYVRHLDGECLHALCLILYCSRLCIASSYSCFAMRRTHKLMSKLRHRRFAHLGQNINRQVSGTRAGITGSASLPSAVLTVHPHCLAYSMVERAFPASPYASESEDDAASVDFAGPVPSGSHHGASSASAAKEALLAKVCPLRFSIK